MINNQIILHIQLVCINITGLPNYKTIKSWVHTIFSVYRKKIELTIRIVDENEMRYLHQYFSKKNYLTNVLSFPVKFPSKIQSVFLGDIVICKSVVEQEARDYNISFHMHLAYMIVHGSLHILGYNHIHNADAILMHQREKYIMQKFGYNICQYFTK